MATADDENKMRKSSKEISHAHTDAKFCQFVYSLIVADPEIDV